MYDGPNNGKTSESPKGNMFSETFYAFFYTIFNSRNQPVDLFSYVPMREEKEIKGFIESNRTDSCIISGARGIGKSTLIEQIERKYKDKEDILLIKIDFNTTFSKRTDADNQSYLNYSDDDLIGMTGLPDDGKLGVDDILASYILSHVDKLFRKNEDGFLTSEEDVEGFYNYINEKHGHFLYGQDITPTVRITHNDRRNVIESIRKHRPFRFMIGALGYLVNNTAIQRVIVAVDNVDDCPSSLIEQIYKRMSSMIVCSVKDKATSLLYIMTCRDYIYNELFSRNRKNIAQYHGHHPIEINKPCPIYAIIQTRVDSVQKKDSDLYNRIDDTIISSNNFKWTISNRDLFLKSLCDLIKKFNYGENLEQLCNYDMSEAIRQFYHNIIRNDDILKLEDILSLMKKNSANNEKYADPNENRPISWPQFLNCFTYGIGSNRKRFYPQKDTVIPNLLWWRYNLGYSILSRIRILQYLENESENNVLNGKLIIEKLMIPYLGFKKDEEESEKKTSAIAVCFLEKMAQDGLIFVSSSRLTTDGFDEKLDLEDKIIASHKAKLLLSLLSEQSLLLEYFYDDTYRHIERYQPDCTLQEIPLAERPRKLFCFLEYITTCEKTQLMHIDTNNISQGLDAFLKLVGKQSISEKIYKGLDQSLKKFYDKDSNDIYLDNLTESSRVINEIKTILGTNDKCLP